MYKRELGKAWFYYFFSLLHSHEKQKCPQSLSFWNKGMKRNEPPNAIISRNSSLINASSVYIHSSTLILIPTYNQQRSLYQVNCNDHTQLHQPTKYYKCKLCFPLNHYAGTTLVPCPRMPRIVESSTATSECPKTTCSNRNSKLTNFVMCEDLNPIK